MNPRVVIGGARPLRIAALVLEYTILKYCPDAEVIQTFHKPFNFQRVDGSVDNTLHRSRWEDPCEWLPTHPTGTMFSYCRTMVPEICGFKGQAIYFDCDMIVFGSVREIWDIPMEDHWILRLFNGQFSVIKLDCEKLRDVTIGNLLCDNIRYRDILTGRHVSPHRIGYGIPNEWNCLDRAHDDMKLLHYTLMPTQPWVKPGHRAGGYWFDCLAEAIKEGFLSLETVVEDVQQMDLKRVWQATVCPQPHVLDELKMRGIT